MLWNSTAFIGYTIATTEGHLGTVNDILFEDANWTVRWLVVDTGHWMPGRKVLLPVSALGEPDRIQRMFPTGLSIAQVKDGPDFDSDKSVSRQHETNIYEFYGLEPYWGGGLYPLSNAMAVPFLAPPPPELHRPFAADGLAAPDPEPSEAGADPHLRSATAVIGYHIHATDGEIGHAADFLIDNSTWSISFIRVDTRNWWPGELVLIAPASVTSIDWALHLINLNVDREKVKGSPHYDPSITVDGAYASRLQSYYGSASIGMM